MLRRFSRSLALCALLAAAMAVGASPAAADVSAKDPWVGETPPGATTAGAYLVLTNTGTEAVTVLGAQTPSCEVVEFHATDMSDDVARMRQLDSLEIPAGGELALAPGGTHLMLIRPVPLKAGDVVSLTFELSNGEQLSVEAPVRRPGGAAASHHEHHAH